MAETKESARGKVPPRVAIDGPAGAGKSTVAKSPAPWTMIAPASSASIRTPIARKAAAVAALSSPAALATTRLLRDGPDAGRGDPTANGLVSVDVRGHRLPPSLEKKYPSIAVIIAGIVRIRGSATLAEDGVRVEAFA